MTWSTMEAEQAAYEERHGWTMELSCGLCGLRWFEWTEDGSFDTECDCGGEVEER